MNEQEIKDFKEYREELLKEASKKYDDKASAEAFVDTFMEKVASFMGFDSGAHFLRDHSKHIGEGFGKALGGLAVAAIGAGVATAVLSGSSAASKLNLRSKFDQSLAKVMASHRLVRTADPDKVKGYAETIFRFAPHVAADPNLLSTLLANVIQGEGIDPMTIKTITELEGRYQDNNTPNNLPRLG